MDSTARAEKRRLAPFGYCECGTGPKVTRGGGCATCTRIDTTNERIRLDRAEAQRRIEMLYQ